MKTRIALTPGCGAGVGPELFLPALHSALNAGALGPHTHLIWCASPALLLRGATLYNVNAKRDHQRVFVASDTAELCVECLLSDSNDAAVTAPPGAPDIKVLDAQRQALHLSIALAKDNQVDAIVTGPIRKAALKADGVPGHTELLAQHFSKDDSGALMCFAGLPFVLGLTTVHVPLRLAPTHITEGNLKTQTKQLWQIAQALHGKTRVQISGVMLGVNPHAGEGGLLGSEELEVLMPALNCLRNEGHRINGPLGADGFFGHLAQTPTSDWPQAVMAMTHDQGLIPYKLLSRGNAVNITAGIKIVRTGPAHGTADDLAHKGLANPQSTAAALRMAVQLARNNERLL